MQCYLPVGSSGCKFPQRLNVIYWKRKWAEINIVPAQPIRSGQNPKPWKTSLLFEKAGLKRKIDQLLNAFIRKSHLRSHFNQRDQLLLPADHACRKISRSRTCDVRFGYRVIGISVAHIFGLCGLGYALSLTGASDQRCVVRRTMLKERFRDLSSTALGFQDERIVVKTVSNPG